MQQVVSGNVAPLLKRVFMFLEDGEWQKADDFCEQVLNQDPENAQAYLGKLMAELRVRKQEQLSDCAELFDGKNNYQKVLRFSDEQLASELNGYINEINKRNENKRKDAIYNSGLAEMSGNTIAKYEAAIKIFESIPGWKDSNDQIIACEKRIEEIKAKEETDRVETARKAEEKRIANELAAKKRKKVISIAAPIAVALITFLIVLTKVIIPNNHYKAAMALYENGQYEEAIVAFEALDGYKDSINQIETCLKDIEYTAAVELMDAGKYEQAIAAFVALDGYKDSTAQIENYYIDKYGEEKWNEIKNVVFGNVGDTVTFGAYEQDNKINNGKEDVEWLVLEREDNKVLVISKYALDCQQYNTKNTGVTWNTCTLRKWLNETFLSEAFSPEEQAIIQTTTVSADNNPEYSTKPGNATEDKVFLLSINEVNKYFTSDEARKCAPTAYAKAQGAYTSSDEKTASGEATCWWWLRSPGAGQNYAALVISGGSVDYRGYGVSYDFDCVRPALWINLDSKIF